MNPAVQHRAQFAERLHAALKKAGHKSSPTALQRLFNDVFTGHPITVHAARKWLVGEAVPTHEKLKVLAELLQTTPHALAWGDAEPDDIVTVTSEDTSLMLRIRALSDDDKTLVEGIVSVLSRRRRHGMRRKGV